MTQLEQAAVQNHLLAALSPDDFALLAPALKPTKLELKRVLYAVDQPVGTAYFLESGIVSMLAPLEEGRFMEVGLVGREGLVGLTAVLGADSAATQALVQAPGTALQLRHAEIKEAFEASTTLRGLLLRYAHAYHAQVAQTAACNGYHLLEERLARWLLMPASCRRPAPSATGTAEPLSLTAPASRLQPASATAPCGGSSSTCSAPLRGSDRYLFAHFVR
jgi:CRP-like cAMP-binding protein